MWPVVRSRSCTIEQFSLVEVPRNCDQQHHFIEHQSYYGNRLSPQKNLRERKPSAEEASIYKSWPFAKSPWESTIAHFVNVWNPPPPERVELSPVSWQRNGCPISLACLEVWRIRSVIYFPTPDVRPRIWNTRQNFYIKSAAFTSINISRHDTLTLTVNLGGSSLHFGGILF